MSILPELGREDEEDSGMSAPTERMRKKLDPDGVRPLRLTILAPEISREEQLAASMAERIRHGSNDRLLPRDPATSDRVLPDFAAAILDNDFDHER